MATTPKLQQPNIKLGQFAFTPDIKDSALGPNEYTSGKNIEIYNRQIKSVDGEEVILSDIPGEVVHITANYRQPGVYSYILANDQGSWYLVNSVDNKLNLTDITPSDQTYLKVNPNTNRFYYETNEITSDWNGTSLIISDNTNPPMYLLADATSIRLYDTDYPDISWTDSTTDDNGDIIYNNRLIWNYYTATRSSVKAKFIRLFNSPNLGPILVAGGLTSDLNSGIELSEPMTVKWSQNTSLTSVPVTWSPTLTTVAETKEIPGSGQVIDGFQMGDTFYLFTYRDVIALMPISYTSSDAPVFITKVINRGRGLLNTNSWCMTDNEAYGMDSRDIWVFSNGKFQSIGIGKVRDYLYSEINQRYLDRVYLLHNSYKSRIEVYYPDQTSTGYCNKYISFDYTTGNWQSPVDVQSASIGIESQRFENGGFNPIRLAMVYASVNSVTNKSRLIARNDKVTSFTGSTINSSLTKPNLSFGQTYTNKTYYHRAIPEVFGNVTIEIDAKENFESNPYKTYESDTSEDMVHFNFDKNLIRVADIRFESNSAWAATGIGLLVSIITEEK